MFRLSHQTDLFKNFDNTAHNGHIFLQELHFRFRAGHPALASCGQLPSQLKQRAVLSGVSDFGGNTAFAVPGDSISVACCSETPNALASANTQQGFECHGRSSQCFSAKTLRSARLNYLRFNFFVDVSEFTGSCQLS